MITEEMIVDNKVVPNNLSDAFKIPNEIQARINKFSDMGNLQLVGFMTSFLTGFTSFTGTVAITLADNFGAALLLGVPAAIVSIISGIGTHKSMKLYDKEKAKAVEDVKVEIESWLEDKHRISVSKDEAFERLIKNISTKYKTSTAQVFYSESGQKYILNPTGEVDMVQSLTDSHSLTSLTTPELASLSVAPETKALLESIERTIKALQPVAVDAESSHTIARAKEDARKALELHGQLSGLYADSNSKASIHPMLELLDDELKSVLIREQKAVQDKISAQYEYIKTRKSGQE